MIPVMIFNGVDMSRFFRVIDIIRPIGNTRSVSTDDAPWLGVNIQQIKRGAKEHTIKFDMVNRNDFELERLKHELAGVLNVTEPVRIVYGDEPDKYYLGMPIDDITPDNIVRWFQRSEMKLLIPDGVAHSTSYSRVDSSKAVVTSDKMVFTLTNNGTVPAYPIITVNHRSDNSYLGLVNQGGAFEVGNRAPIISNTSSSSTSQPTIQTTTYLKLDYRDEAIASGYTSATKNVAPVDNVTQLVGTLNTYTSGGSHVRVSSRGNPSMGRSSAASLTWDISSGSDTAEEYLWWRQVFQASAVYEVGYLKIFFTDSSGRLLYGVETSKSVNGYDCTYKLLSADGKGGTKIVKLWTFKGTSQIDKNPFTEGKGQVELIRQEDKVQVSWLGASLSFNVPELKGKKAVKLHVLFGDYNGFSLNRLELYGLLFRKEMRTMTTTSTSTEAPVVVPARSYLGKTLVINSETDMLTMDGLPKNSAVVHGSQWLTLPPGESQLEVYVSSTVQDKPSVSIAFEERWL